MTAIISSGGGPAATIKMQVGQSVVTTIKAATQVGRLPIAYSVGGVNAELVRVGPASGVLTFVRTPTPGAYSVTVKATDRKGATASQRLSVVVPVAPWLLTAARWDDRGQWDDTAKWID